MIGVSVFSAHPMDLVLILNRGAQLKIPAVAANWQPSLAPSGSFGFDNGGPSADNFGPGANVMQIKVGEGDFYDANIVLPDLDPEAIQFYLFGSVTSASSAHWAVLFDGNVVTTDLGVVVV